jgi:hypothetical protein
MQERNINRQLARGTGIKRLHRSWKVSLVEECRANPAQHIPKRTGNLENPITHEKVFDDTHDRIHGPREDEAYFHYNHSYGATKNPVDDFPKMGKRQHLLETTVIISLKRR